MAEPGIQRHYRAPCPGCGAPVEFRSAQSTHAVCAYCHSTVVRSGEVLQRIGKMAELFDDHSPLQLMASGRIRLDGAEQPFTLVGRLQFKGEAGPWSEWIAALPDGRSGTLSEDNGAYVFTLPAALGRVAPEAAQFRLGSTTAVSGKRFAVAANLSAQLMAAEGELPRLPPLGQPFQVVELRSDDGEVLAIDYSSDPPEAQRGRAVRLDELHLQGLKDEAPAKAEQGRQFSCPNCGTPVPVQLDNTLAATCPSCASVIDLSQGLGGELRFARQARRVEPMIALGRVGQFDGASWQVVGFQRRTGMQDGEEFSWDEYLLYHAQRGFQFLVDSSEGWSLMRPTAGAPKLQTDVGSATYLGATYRRKDVYNARTDFVLGEFYWPVKSSDKTHNIDFEQANGRGVLSREQSGNEVTWSHGERLNATQVAGAFKMDDQAGLFRRQDAAPVALPSGGIGCGTVILVLVILFIVFILLSQCTSSSSGGSGYRGSGGSFGGYTSGGGHK